MAMMRIGADASHVRGTPAGLGRYLDGMLHGLADTLGADDEMVVFYNSARGAPMFGPRVKERFLRVPTGSLWNQVALPIALLRDRCDVFLGGANIIPIATRVPRVLVVHDCKVFRIPEVDPLRAQLYWRWWMRASARRATRIVAVSRFAAGDCEEYLGVAASDVTVIYQGVHPRFRPAAGEEARADADALSRLGLSGRFVLQVGGFEARKGGDTARRAIAQVRVEHPEVSLVRCGYRGNAGAFPGVRDLGYVSDADLVTLYRTAAAVCVPSLMEGFGLPVVEAMACGTPVVTSDVGGLPEAGGDAALYVGPNEPEELARNLAHLLSDADEVKRRREAGLRQAAKFRWDASAAAMRKVLEQVAARKR